MVAEAVVAGCRGLAVAYDFSAPGREWEFPRLSADDAREELLATIFQGPALRPRADLLSSLVSDAAVTRSGRVVPTELCLLHGQGHQFFLARLSQSARMIAPSIVAGKKRIREPVAAITRALFQPWERSDATPSLRWDTGWVHRQWFNRFSDPAKDPVRTEAGAYTLAAIGLPLLTVSPVTAWRRIRMATLCVHAEAQALSVVWPIWTKALSLQSLRRLLSHPTLYKKLPDRALWSQLGIREVRWSGRVRQGRWTDFKRSVAIS